MKSSSLIQNGERNWKQLLMKVNIGPFPEEGEQQIDVAIDKWDTWSMDTTLASIIHPMLVQLKATKHGSPPVDMGDVPEHLRINDPESTAYWTTGETDEKFHDRWDWVLDEMIWAFEQKLTDWEDQYHGEYVEDAPLGESFPNMDHDGLERHQERMSQAFRMFGKYYENLWD